MRDDWRTRLGTLTLDLPPQARDLAETVRANLAWILVNRDGKRFRVDAVEHGWVCGSGLCHEKRSARAREPQPPLRRSVLFAGNRDQQLPYIDRTTPDAIPSSCRSLLGRGLRRAAVHRHHDLQHSGIDRKLWCAGRRLSLTCVVSLKEYSRGHAEPLCKSFRLAYVDFASTRQDL